MNMNVDMLKMLYSNTVSNTNTLKSNTDVSNVQDSFLKTLNEVLMRNSETSSSKENNLDLLNSIIGNSKDENEKKSNDLLTSLMLLMQQGVPMQSNIIDYNNLLGNMSSTDSLNIDTINNVIQNIQSTSNLSYDNLESLLLGLQSQNTQQNSSATNIETANTQIKTENLFAGRSFPKEIMESINAVRQAHDNIRSKIEQTKNIAVGAVETNNEGTAQNTNKSFQDIQISVISNDTVQNNANDSIVNNNSQMSNSTNISDEVMENNNQLNTDLKMAVASEVNSTSKGTISDNKELNNSIINESLLNVNGVDIQNSSKIIKINDESSLIKESVMTQIKDQIVLMKSDGKQTVTMQLTPENLGKLDIKMVFEKGNLSVEILASNPKTHSLILSNISELKSVLQNSIADRTFMNVDNQKQMYEQNQNQNNQSSSHHQERNDRNEREYQQTYTDTSDNNDGIDFMTELTRLRDYRFSTVSQI